jgi:hypothetical protein
VSELHSCPFCPAETRDLLAVAHNAVVNYGTGREQDKMADPREMVARYQVAIDAHFEALKNKAPETLRAEIAKLTAERDEWKRRAATHGCDTERGNPDCG